MSQHAKTYRPAWLEGMPLVVQSFQQLQRSLDGATALLAQCRTLDWGLWKLELIENLSQGELGVRVCQAILRDGTLIDIPHSDEQCMITGLDKRLPSHESAEVCLALPKNRVVRRSSNPETRRQVRYVRETLSNLDDEFGEAQAEQIEVLKQNLRLELFIGRTANDSESILLPVARIGRVGRRLELLPNYIPPCVSISGSGELIEMVRRVVMRGHERVNSLMQALGPQVAGGQISLSPQSTHRLWVLQTLAPAVNCLSQLLDTVSVHPRELYQELIRLLSSLIPLYRQEMLVIPRYDHEDLYGCFHGVCRLLDELLGAREHKEFEYFELAPSGDPALWLFRTQDLGFLRRSTLFLGLACDRSQPELDEHFSNVKHLPMMREGDIASSKLQAGQDGMNLVSVPAARLPDKEWVDDDVYWFQLKLDTNQSKTSWELILRDGRISVWMPELSKLNLKQKHLIAVQKDTL